VQVRTTERHRAHHLGCDDLLTRLAVHAVVRQRGADHRAVGIRECLLDPLVDDASAEHQVGDRPMWLPVARSDVDTSWSISGRPPR
jgi:hypothetical protein